MLQQSENICCNILYSYLALESSVAFFITAVDLYFSVKLYVYIDIPIDWKLFAFYKIILIKTQESDLKIMYPCT